MGLFNKSVSRRGRIRKEINPDWGFGNLGRFASPEVIYSAVAWLMFVILCVPVLGYEWIQQFDLARLASMAVMVVLICLAIAMHIHLYQKRFIRNPARVFGLAIFFSLLLITAKISVALTGQYFWTTATAVTAALILTITFSQQFAAAMIFFYCALTYLATARFDNINVLFTMIAASLPFCFFLSDIRTRMKLLEVSLAASFITFLVSAACEFLASAGWSMDLLRTAGSNAAVTFFVGVLIQGLLPVLEKVFRIATSMTLLDYSDANQPLLRRLAIEAPGTFSHSLLIGTISEAAAEEVGRNGLLCRVGAYYHDIGKINKPGYFVENQLGSVSWHKELSPQMSQLIIVGHIKDGMELAEEYGLPAVLRQFIETHHGTTLVEYFYDRAVKQHEQNGSADSTPPSEGEFRYPGPKPRTKEAAIIMIADAVEGAVRSLSEPTPTKIEAVVHNIAMRRLQDGQFDECDLSLRELSRIEASISKSVAAYYHGRIAYPKPPETPPEQV
ncbi:MAG: HDIG domain-containing protein [Sedimentisphaerales bacterium]|nr:HDIG domain-containing protein [Sedimentisphaerales bacterium]